MILSCLVISEWGGIEVREQARRRAARRTSALTARRRRGKERGGNERPPHKQNKDNKPGSLLRSGLIQREGERRAEKQKNKNKSESSIPGLGQVIRWRGIGRGEFPAPCHDTRCRAQVAYLGLRPRREGHHLVFQVFFLVPSLLAFATFAITFAAGVGLAARPCRRPGLPRAQSEQGAETPSERVAGRGGASAWRRRPNPDRNSKYGPN